VALRRKVDARVDVRVAEDAVQLVATLTGGRRVEVAIDHAIGSRERPMSDAMLDAKVHDLCDAVLGAARTTALIASCRSVASHAHLDDLLALATP